MSDLDRMFGDPMKQIEDIILGTNILRKAEHTPTPEYTEAFNLLEPYGVYATTSDRTDQLMLTVGAAADLIADNYVRRES